VTSPGSDDRIREESLWFGPANRPLFARLTSPATSQLRGGILLSPPIGREARLARHAMRALAIRLASDGYASLRFDHFATGNSSGSFDDDEFVGVWFETLDWGSALLRSYGAPVISAVGMRIGATILAAAATQRDLGLTSAVLWDPCESGRTFLRESSALGALGRELDGPDSGGPVKRLEYVYPEEASKRLGELNVYGPATEPLAKRILIVVRDDRVVSEKFRANWSEGVEWTTTSEQGALLETELPSSVLATGTLAEIRAWLTAPEAPWAAMRELAPRQDTALLVGRNGQAIRERLVEVGPHRLFSVVCEPVGDVMGPLIVLVNGINEDHVGPSRLWVELSRLWAGYGLRCLRFDGRGLGESPWTPDQPDPPLFDKNRPVDIRDATRALTPSGPTDSVLIGLCSGALVALEVAREYKSRGLCLINPQVGTGLVKNANRMETSAQPLLRSLAQRGDRVLKRHRWIGKLVRQISRVVLATATSPKVRATLVNNGTEMLLLASPDELAPFPWIPIIGSIDHRRLVSSAHYRIEVVNGMDHDFLNDVGRQRAVAILERHVLETFAGVAPQ
jgi:pimeloyl-ACP methyl ester carboxylesterase